jgi:hypothetical protein
VRRRMEKKKNKKTRMTRKKPTSHQKWKRTITRKVPLLFQSQIPPKKWPIHAKHVPRARARRRQGSSHLAKRVSPINHWDNPKPFEVVVVRVAVEEAVLVEMLRPTNK